MNALNYYRASSEAGEKANSLRRSRPACIRIFQPIGKAIFMMNKVNALRIFLLSTLLVNLAACAAPGPYKAYFGDPREDMQLSILEGGSYIRVELLNRYVDTIRFMEIDEIPIPNPVM